MFCPFRVSPPLPTNIVDVTKKEHEQKGLTGAIGAGFRLVPPTVMSPVIIAADATSNVLSGMRNQLQPDAKKEDDEKWKANQTWWRNGGI